MPQSHQFDARVDVRDGPMTASPQPYQPLNSESREIRVLELSGGSWQEGLAGTLRTASLDSQPSYEALSYTWGVSNESRSITIDKHSTVSITDNLARALRRLRGRLTKRTIWCDAICIDQSNIEEREHQVSIMGDIYKGAVTVLVWLGEYPNASSSDQWFMRRPHWKRSGSRDVINSRGRRFAKAIDAAIRETQPRWSNRAWTVQEFVLSKETMLCFGPVSIAYDPVHIIDFLILHQEPLPYLRAFHEKTSDMVKLRYGVGAAQQSIAEAALFTSTADCSDARDRVHSLLSLIDVDEARMIGTSYRHPCAEIFAKATYASIFVQKSSLAFELVRFHGSTVPDLPTWAIDFTQQQVPNVGRIHQYAKNETSNINFAARESGNVHFSSDAGQLTIAGASVGSVVRISKQYSLAPSQQGSQAFALARGLAPILNELIESHSDALRPDNVRMLSLGRVEPSLLCPFRDDGTPVNYVLGAACAVWYDAIGYRFRDQEPVFPAYWQSEVRTRQTRSAGNDLFPFIEYTLHVSGEYVAFMTSDGFFGIAPSSIAVGDTIVLADNSRFPLILRSSRGSHAFRGLVYAHGVMQDQPFASPKGGECAQSTFVLA